LSTTLICITALDVDAVGLLESTALTLTVYVCPIVPPVKVAGVVHDAGGVKVPPLGVMLHVHRNGPLPPETVGVTWNNVAGLPLTHDGANAMAKGPLTVMVLVAFIEAAVGELESVAVNRTVYTVPATPPVKDADVAHAPGPGAGGENVPVAGVMVHVQDRGLVPPLALGVNAKTVDGVPVMVAGVRLIVMGLLMVIVLVAKAETGTVLESVTSRRTVYV
jgi:hypothetical protein